jgi:hypothetical protein
MFEIVHFMPASLFVVVETLASSFGTGPCFPTMRIRVALDETSTISSRPHINS